jgi:phosphatidylglycerophosphatase A
VQIKFLEKLLGSGFYTGFIPFASGTFASAVALAVYFIPGFEKNYIIIPITLLFFLIGIPIGTKFEKVYGKDPGECTIDEVAGMWMSLLFIPKTILYAVIGFFIWRFFDIIKPYPARNLEKINGGLGIMIDDFVAALYSLITIHLTIFLIHKFS